MEVGHEAAREGRFFFALVTEERDRAGRILPLLWIGAAIASFVYYIGANDAVRWAASRFAPLAIAAMFLACCIGYGALLRARDVASAAALGTGVVALVVFVAGLLHLFHRALFVSIIAVGLVALLVTLLRIRHTPIVRPRQSIGWLLIVATAIAVIPFVLAPEVSTDALEYHLLIPKQYLMHGGIDYLPLFVESNYPSLAEYNYVALLSVVDARAAKAFHFLIALVLLGAIARFAKSIAPERDGVLAAALFFMMPVAALTSGWAWNDMLFVLFVVLSLMRLHERYFVEAGIYFGLATWTKYTFVLIGIGFLVLLLRGVVARWWTSREVVRFAIPVASIAALWAIKNFVFTGNPVYPFLNGVFHSPFWSAESQRYFVATLTHYEIPQWHWWTWVAFPLLIALQPRVIDTHPGPLMLILLPLLFFRSESRGESLLKTFIVGTIGAWLLIRTETRSLLSVFAVVAILYALSIERVPLRRLLIGAGLAVNLVIILLCTHVITDPTRFFLGRETAQQYVERMDAKQRVYGWLNANGSVRGVLLVGLHDPFYLDKASLFSSLADKPVAQDLVERTGSAPRMHDVLRAAGVTHVVVRRSEYRRENVEHLYSWNDAQRGVFRDFLATCKPVASFGDVIVFAVQ